MASYVFEPFLLQGALTAIKIAAVAMVGGIVLGLPWRWRACRSTRRYAA